MNILYKRSKKNIFEKLHMVVVDEFSVSTAAQ